METIDFWKDIFKVLIDEITLVLEVLDARNPIGTFNHTVEEYIKDNHLNIEIVIVLNKIDMIPREYVKKWYDYFTNRGYQVFSTTARYDGGVTKLKKYLRQLPASRVNNVLIVGYPNTGKSSLIESISKHSKKVGVSSNAGFTRALMKIKIKPHVFLVDSPGVIPFDEKNEVDMVLKSCLLVDKVEDTLSVVEAIFNLLPISQFNSLYDLNLDENNATLDDLIEAIGRRFGLLAKGGVVNRKETIKKLIRDWQSNRLKYYIAPPSEEEIDGLENLSNNKDIKSVDKSYSTYIPENKEEEKEIEETPKRKKGMIPPSLNRRNK